MGHIYLAVLLALILLLPFLVRGVEEQMEYFLFAAGAAAVTITSSWSVHVVIEAAKTPIIISAAVLVSGVIFELLSGNIASAVEKMSSATGKPLLVFLMILALGLFSSFFTAIIAALLLTEIISHINLPRDSEIKIVVISCFAIGLGAILTPAGEPLSTIVTAKLSGEPFNAGFFFLLEKLWIFVVPAIIFFAAAGAFIAAKAKKGGGRLKEDKREGLASVLLRTVKVYIFVAGLVLLASGFRPLVETYIAVLPHYLLYWMNIISAVLDNATLAAAEISPVMSILQIKSAVLGLAIAGGMLIPGNIPNIISANKLGIKSSEWARFAMPFGMAVMAFFFLFVMAAK
jgi:predicted cation transporter